MVMEYITGVTTLQAIFTIHWLAYCDWYKGVIRPTVYENIKKILACRTPQLGYHLYQPLTSKCQGPVSKVFRC